MRLRSRTKGLIALAALLGVAPLSFANGYIYDVAINAVLNAVVCVGLNLLMGYGGQISLGHAGFVALGAYGSAILTGTYGVPPLAALAVSAVGVGGLAFALGRPILRLRGHSLAMATLGVGVIVHIVLKTEAGLTGGPDGLVVEPMQVAGIAVTGEGAWYAVAAVTLLVAVWLAGNLVDSPAGRALRALRDSEVGAQAAGVDTARCKVAVFVVSAMFASVAGSLLAHKGGFITPDLGGFLRSVELVAMVVLGGMGSMGGAVAGAVLLTVLPQALAGFQDYEAMALGAIMMATMVFLPQGLVPSLRRRLGRGRGAS